MTVLSTTRKAGPFVGDGVTTSFPFTFKCFAKSDVVATLTVIATGVESTLVLDSPTGYSVALNADQDANPGGTVTYNPSGTPMPATQKLTLTSNVAQSQGTSITNGGGFFPKVIEAALDKAIILIQQLALTISQGLRVSVSDTTPGPLPSKAARALNFLAFDSNGDPIASAGGASSPVSSAMAPVVAAATLAAAQSAMGVAPTASPTFTGTLNASEAVALTGVVSPAQITADQNNYAPTGFAAASMLRINSDAARSITGLAGGTAGRLMALRNVGAFAITLKDESASSTAGNRFALSADYVLATDQSVLLEYDSVSSRWMLYGQQSGSASSGAFMPLTAAVNANALTVTLAAGAVLNFNDGSTVTLAAPITATASSGSTFGTVNAVAGRLWVAALKNGGTPELALFNARSGTNIAPIDLGGTISTTAEGGAGAADSAQTWYSTTARATQAFCVAGYVDSTQAVAGTWATAPSKTQGFGPGVFMPGSVVQALGNKTGAVATGTTTIPNDDTIPQNTEGDQYLSQAITVIAAANVLAVEISAYLATGAAANNNFVMALLQDAIANALASAVQWEGVADRPFGMRIRHTLIAGAVGSTTFKMRAGNEAAGTTTFNGAASARKYGDSLASRIDVWEIMA